MNTCGWILFIVVIADATLRASYTVEGRDHVIKPSWGGVVLTIGMCVLTWFAVNP